MRTNLVGLALLLLVSASNAQVADPQGETQPPAPVPAADLNWVDFDPVGAPGVKVATLWGDVFKSDFGAFLKLPAGFAAPLHSHTHAMKLVIVSGTYIQGPQGKPEFRLGPGSYLMQPGGNYNHTTRCDASSECVLFFESEGAFDLHPAPPPAK